MHKIRYFSYTRPLALIKMNRRRQNKSQFIDSSLIIGIASVLLVILLTSYFFDLKNTDYEPIEFGVILTNPDYYSESDIQGWHTVNIEKFTIQTPVEFKLFRLRGYDSFVGGLTDLNDTLFFDFGLYSNTLKELTSPDFEVFNETINSKKFRITIGQNDLKYIAAYTDDLQNDNRLMIDCSNCRKLDQKKRIIETIEFKEK